MSRLVPMCALFGYALLPLVACHESSSSGPTGAASAAAANPPAASSTAVSASASASAFVAQPLSPKWNVAAPIRAAGVQHGVEYGRNIHIIPYGLAPEPAPTMKELAAQPPAYHLNYYGGRVISAVKVIVVLWGSAVNQQVATGMQPFFSTIANGSYMDWLKEYNTEGVAAMDGKPGSNQIITRGSAAKTVTITPGNAAKALNDKDLVTELNAQIDKGKVDAPDLDTIYMMYFPPGVQLTDPEGGKSCASGGFCAYHGTFRRNGSDVFYGVFPDFGKNGGCDTGCGTDAPFDNMTSTSSHELVEAITDAEIGLTNTVQRPIAWYDGTGGEIGDICNAQHAKFGKYTVQREWSNRQGICFVPTP